MAELQWTALLVLARLGDVRAAQRAVEIIDSEEPIRDRVSSAAAYLTYTRHPVAVDYIVQNILMSDARAGRGPYDVPVAWGGVVMLSEMVEDFPALSMEVRLFKQDRSDDIKIVRDWARQQTTWRLKK